jgi:hypothetical protein
MTCSLKVINCPASPYSGDPRHWNCILYSGGAPILWTPGYTYMVVDTTDLQNPAYEQIVWYFSTGTSQLSVTADMQIVELWYSQFIYQRFGVAAVIKDNVDYVWNCATHKVEELAAAEPKFSELKIYNYAKV